MDFTKMLNTSASLIKKYAPKYNILVVSPILAQMILESGRFESELAVNANNYFGIKYKKGRCPTACGIYHKIGSEQNSDGTYSSSAMQWCKFKNIEDCIIGYLDFINIARYSNLKGVTDPKTYLENIKKDGYATSLKYVDNLLAVISKYNLTKYDSQSNNEGDTKPMIKIAIDAGHGANTLGKRCLKSIDPYQTREWWLNDRIADRLQNLLSGYNCEVIRVDDTTGKKDISLATRANMANNKKADVYISIHHNAGLNGRNGGGTVVYYYSSNSERAKQAQKLYNSVVGETNLVGNRSSKVIKNGFYVIKNTKMPAFLIENGFMDSPTDVPVILSAEHAEKTAQGLLKFLVAEYGLSKNGNSVPNNKPVTPPTNNKPTTKFIKNGVDYSLVFDPTYYSNKHPDLKRAFGNNSTSLFNHFYTYGMKEGRQAITTFNVTAYKNRYVDLQKAFKNDLPSYYKHYVQFGHKENRIGV